MAGLASVFGLIRPEREKTLLIPSRRPPEIKEAIRLLESHLDRPWSVQALASIVALSPSQLTRLFTKHAGTSPARHLRDAGTRRMHQLLVEGVVNVSEAAHLVGWNDPSHASRAYRTVFGRAPSTVRTQRITDSRALKDW